MHILMSVLFLAKYQIWKMPKFFIFSTKIFSDKIHLYLLCLIFRNMERFPYTSVVWINIIFHSKKFALKSYTPKWHWIERIILSFIVSERWSTGKRPSVACFIWLCCLEQSIKQTETSITWLCCTSKQLKILIHIINWRFLV